MNPEVDDFLSRAQNWQNEMKELRTILLECGLTEEFKWRQPCYSFKGANILIIGGFKNYCTLSFFKGTLLKDTEGILESPGENSQAARMMKFTSIQEIIEKKSIAKAYIFEAIEVEKAGLKVDFKEKNELKFSEELQHKLAQDPEFKAAFEALTPGKKRGYNLYFSAAKQSETRKSRIEKYSPRILNGFGFHDCVCGQSKRHPRCDGSHKFIEGYNEGDRL